MNKLEQLKKVTTIVADTGDIDAVKAHAPTDATTNPSLILQATEKPQYAHLIEDAVHYAKGKGGSVKLLMEKLFVNFGAEILKFIPGRVSTEVDARLSFDVEESIQTARDLISLYHEVGVPREKVLIKLASTWEGIQACRELEKEGIHCNMTLMFSIGQAVACSDARATLISPFVGRILDWYKKSEGVESYPADQDPGVLSVTQIYHYFKKFGIKTQVMGASFRNKEEVLELAGCDLLTISPNLLEEISNEKGELPIKLSADHAKDEPIEKIEIDEKTFRWMLNENAMATEKLAEGIRKFAADSAKLEKKIQDKYF
ncbi:transaldolase [Waddlia chondrophila 2032/99]|uniref:Transaldolase n=2 Tax=Waddlia chondrophila TaxID=71667 RepID=D6YV03_WADCW|nr:transaldolase [Waddlia chondrophila]ADI37964.1 Transaldolase [Waddlia chondrophila WSU 86-1044]CCB91896.1 transaldolase [Waddlia chondrophila 2032/99]